MRQFSARSNLFEPRGSSVRHFRIISKSPGRKYRFEHGRLEPRKGMKMLLLILLIILLLAVFPTWPYSRGWGYYPTSGVGLILVIILILMLMGIFHL